MTRPLVLAALAVLVVNACKPWANEDLTALGDAPVYRALSASNDQTCGIGSDGQAYCWGQGILGTLLATDICSQRQDLSGIPIPPVECVKRPIRVSGKHQFTSIASGETVTVGVTGAGALWAWGANWNGTISQAGRLDSVEFYPRQVAGTETIKFKSAAAGTSTICGLTEDSRVFCWGQRNLVTARMFSGLVCAAGLNKCVVAPAQIGTSATWKQVVVGREHACALDTGGTVYCWGNGLRGQLGATGLPTCPAFGTSTVPCRLDPTPIAGTTRFTTLAAAMDATCGVSTTGTLWCWGTGVFSTSSQTVSLPSQIGTAADWNAIALSVTSWEGGPAACGIRGNGNWWCFGPSQIGGGPNPRQITGAPALAGVVVGDDHACGWTASGDAWCIGDKHNGALGDGSVTYQFVTTPIQVSLPYRD